MCGACCSKLLLRARVAQFQLSSIVCGQKDLKKNIPQFGTPGKIWLKMPVIWDVCHTLCHRHVDDKKKTPNDQKSLDEILLHRLHGYFLFVFYDKFISYVANIS